jgi:glutamyl/glutaminyl-tRNA synthetase
MKRLGDALPLMEPLFPESPLNYEHDTLLGKGFAGDPERGRAVLEAERQALEGLAEWDNNDDRMVNASRAAADSLGEKFGDFMTPVRVAVSGRTIHLPIFNVMEIIGREETLRRLEQAALLLAVGA